METEVVGRGREGRRGERAALGVVEITLSCRMESEAVVSCGV